MSMTMDIVCMTCKEYLWIGQDNNLYYGQPEVMKALRDFLVKHRSDMVSGDIHELIYHPEPWNFFIDDDDDEWVEWEIENRHKKINSLAKRIVSLSIMRRGQ